MIDRLDPLFDIRLCSLALIISTAAFLFMEWKNQPRLPGWRMAAVVGMMIAMAGLLLRPLSRQPQSDAVVLLTENYDPASVDSVLALGPGMRILHLQGADAYKNSLAVASVNQLSRYRDRITHVAGAGLNAEARDAIGAAKFTFIPAPFPAGVLQLSVPGEVYPHRPSSIEGVIKSETENLKVILLGPGGKEDSLVIPHSGIHAFKLNFTPKQPGNFLYEMQAGEKRESVPVTVTERVPMDILMIQDYPTFEMRQLKSFLSERHRLMIRSRISRERFRYEYINRKPGETRRITGDMLAGFDLLIVDSDAFENFSRAESTDLKKSIRDGLGMMIIFNKNPSSVKGTTSLLRATFTAHRHDTAKVTIGETTRTLPAWPVIPRFSSAAHPVTINGRRLLSAFVSDGFGKIGFQLLQETHRLALQGDSLAYGALWSPLLEETARATDRTFITYETPFPLFENTPVTFTVRPGRSHSSIPNVSYAGVQIPLIEDSRIDQVWSGKVWVGHPGWHSLAAENGDREFPFFVSERGSWQSLSMANDIKETLMKAKSAQPVKATTTALVPISPWLFYIVFLLSAGFLWLSPKL